MPIERHAFISYSHIDNEVMATATEKVGWVTLFHKVLQQMLASRLGEKVNIWRDERLGGSDVFPAEIADKLKDTAVLISVISPRYPKSQWCRDEMAQFCALAEGNGGLVLDNKCRVFKVIKFPLDSFEDDALPPTVNQTLGYEFFEVADDGTTFDLDPNFGEKYKQEFLRRTAAVASDLKRVVTLLSGKPPTLRPTVYLATCSQDRRAAREMIGTELERLGCTVLPDHPLPTDEAAFVDDVRTMLARCRLAIHLVGAGYGLVPDGAGQRSVVELQNELAAERCRAGDMARVIWLPADTAPQPGPQAAFIERLHKDGAAQFGADLLTGDLETFKLAVRGALAKLAQPSPPPPAPIPPPPERAMADSVAPLVPPGPAATTAPLRKVHVVYDAADRKASIDLMRTLQQHARLTRPVFADDVSAMRDANQALMLECDEVWLVYGAGDEAWRYHQQRELERVRALRPGRPLPPETLVLAAPDTDDKSLLADLGLPGHAVVDLRQGLDAAAQATIRSLLGAGAAAP